eukprot:TRINITY_DN490_c0_g2_i1.p1 TRINITY_DN490_c0_g2~~TRINITY_DN490_c0_g2_i1.p1  ORF type:complete len:991 (-),score=335.04 TRINITY_DN490_c0_g2_i1:260-3124(-)
MSAVELPCYLLIHEDKAEAKVDDLRKMLEKGDVPQKIAAMKQIIVSTANGEKLPQLLVPILRFATPCQDHVMKKLLLLYWEVVEKHDPTTGKLKPEMILACNALLRDLNHASEYVRGSTLRFLTKVKEAELLEPLVPTIVANLENRHAYVRRNAVLALNNLYRNFPQLLPNGPDLIVNFLRTEGDASCRRNALLMLYHSAPELATAEISTMLDQVSTFGEILQLAVVEIVRKACRTNPADRPKYLKCIFSLLSSSSPAVRFEAAGTLLLLTSVPTSVKAAASTFIDLLCSESDNNVKLVILDRLNDIKRKHASVMQEQVMDLLRVLASPTMEIRRKTLEIALDMISQKNIDEVILVLKKELNKTQDSSFDKAAEYRQMVVQTIHQCAVRFPDVACSVVHLLMDFLGDSGGATSAVDVIAFVREVVETYPNLRKSILVKLLESTSQIKSSKVYRSALWIIAEYAEDQDDVTLAFATLKDALGDLRGPAAVAAEHAPDAEAAAPAVPSAPAASGVRVLADGTYASQAAIGPADGTVAAAPAADVQQSSSLRSLLIREGDYFLATVLASTLSKLVLKAERHEGVPADAKYKFCAEVMLILARLLMLDQHFTVPRPMDSDSRERICLYLRVLSERDETVRRILLREGRSSFAATLADRQKTKADAAKKQADVIVQVDDLIKLPHLLSKRPSAVAELAEDDQDDKSAVTGKSGDDGERLGRIVQLTGYSDPLYAEAVVAVHQYDIMLDVLVINQTSTTVQNVTLELATLGDLKLCERPQLITISPGISARLKANIKVSSTETGVIFGNLVFEVAGQSVTQNIPDRNCVVLSEIRIDVVDYISPATCSDIKFRQMWAEFEWENKIAVSTNITDVYEFLKHIVKATNMNCLTPGQALEGDCGFLSANLYAKSVFGEDALANVSVEAENGKISGFVRIRSKTQGIALSLGEKVTLKQKMPAH